MKIPGSLFLYVPILAYILQLIGEHFPDFYIKVAGTMVGLLILVNLIYIIGIIIVTFNEGFDEVLRICHKDIDKYNIIIKIIIFILLPVIPIVLITDYLNKKLTIKI